MWPHSIGGQYDCNPCHNASKMGETDVEAVLIQSISKLTFRDFRDIIGSGPRNSELGSTMNYSIWYILQTTDFASEASIVTSLMCIGLYSYHRDTWEQHWLVAAEHRSERNLQSQLRWSELGVDQSSARLKSWGEFQINLPGAVSSPTGWLKNPLLGDNRCELLQEKGCLILASFS